MILHSTYVLIDILTYKMKIFLVIFEIFGILFIDYSESRVIKRSAQIYNDDSTSVGQQVGPATVINNPPGGNNY